MRGFLAEEFLMDSLPHYLRQRHVGKPKWPLLRPQFQRQFVLQLCLVDGHCSFRSSYYQDTCSPVFSGSRDTSSMSDVFSRAGHPEGIPDEGR